jgi:putative acetyltransferase
MMPAGYEIVRAQQRHVSSLAAIERSAARLLQGHAPPDVLAETTSAPTLARAVDDGRLWVALSGSVPVGFALVEMLSRALPHLVEIDVDPAHGRRGVGAALVHTVCEWASVSGYSKLTLTTFREVPFNMPFYARMGFVQLAALLPAALAAIVEQEAARGLRRESRVVMQYDPSPSIRRSTPEDREILFDIWLRSAHATHSFVSDDDLQSFRTPVREYLASDAELWVLCSATGTRLGFMGLDGSSLESLFLAPEYLRRGFGRRLVSHARRLREGLRVDVNEQNPGAVAFYEACGFTIDGRSDVDDNGKPYPILHMRTSDHVHHAANDRDRGGTSRREDPPAADPHQSR